ncbi:ATP-dependent Clp protease adaptor ClpS [uncultured Tateyamaria sp.]|uniref:ATP-dependent Clp protease adaptor ClpS n=1 Tax=uncultured Tateyamaria sp. TaxID=455651 RepID=UPI0026376220|nr:ATP-dependent Clp protease adaptor ClpS [uncultured Tateyamaria sp.]
MDRFFGIKLLNDDTTPMDAVVRMLRETLDLSEAVAFERMLRVHQNGQDTVFMGTVDQQDLILRKIEAWTRSNACPVAYRGTGPHSHQDYSAWLDDHKNEAAAPDASSSTALIVVVAIILLVFAGVAVPVFW